MLSDDEVARIHDAVRDHCHDRTVTLESWRVQMLVEEIREQRQEREDCRAAGVCPVCGR